MLTFTKRTEVLFKGERRMREERKRSRAGNLCKYHGLSGGLLQGLNFRKLKTSRWRMGCTTDYCKLKCSSKMIKCCFKVQNNFKLRSFSNGSNTKTQISHVARLKKLCIKETHCFGSVSTFWLMTDYDYSSLLDFYNILYFNSN